jgi:hypothetical protein
MYNPSGVSTLLVRELYLEHRWPPSVIARHLGCSRQVVNHRLRRSGAMADPRAVTPFCSPGHAPTAEYTFPGLLREYIARDGRSSHAIGKVTEVDSSYLRRCALGQRGMTAELCGRVATALHLSTVERDRLYVAAGHVPPTLLRLGGWTDELASICVALVQDVEGGLT